MSISRGRYVVKFCRPNESYTGRPIPESGRCNTTSFWMVAVHSRTRGSLIQIPGPSFGVFADFEQAKTWAIQRLNELVAQEQDNAGI